VALVNESLTVILGRQDAGVVVFTKAADRRQPRAEVRPLPVKGFAAGRKQVAIVENTGGAVAVRTTGEADNGKRLEVVYRLSTGQPTLEVRPGEGVASVSVRAVVGYVVVPEFFADDVVAAVSDRRWPRLPAENMVLGLSPRGVVVMCLWSPDPKGAQGVLVEPESFSTWRITGAKDKPVWVAFLEDNDSLWDTYSVRAEPSEKGTAPDWKPPFAAKWRVNYVGQDGLCQSGTFEEPSGMPAAPQGFRGNRVIYPIDRIRKTPLDVFTPMDIMRNTLGVGPCQYILEAEGLAGPDAATPTQVMDWVEKQLKRKKAADAADEIRARLKAMVEHMGRTRARIQMYADLAEQTRGLLAGKPVAVETLRGTVAGLRESAAAGLAATEPPERAAKLADEIAGLAGKESAPADVARPSGEVRAIGAAQDRALAKCRMAVRCLNVQGETLVAEDPKNAEFAGKIRAAIERALASK